MSSSEQQGCNKYDAILKAAMRDSSRPPRSRSRRPSSPKPAKAALIVKTLDDVRLMTEALLGNASVSHVCISCLNNLGLAGCEALALVIRRDTTLEGVDFGMNYIGDKGALVLADALRDNTTLRDINLAGNDITEGGAQVLADAAKSRAIRPKLRNVDAAHVRLLHRAGGRARDYQLIRSLTGISLPMGGEGQRIMREGAFEALKLWIMRELQTAPKGALPRAMEKVNGALGPFVTFEILRMIPDLFRHLE
uniref:Uncharacterized protein n=1 Tax=Odontella aurita TaxID=265563 RepID=A0A7S4MGA3_9STRA|mmetsp:Transcript_20689/g.60155  ORF Transcript_20689/g.60155 Transcript_20689/m.60155 type:complete len:251 (+) Transcript_20689:213-965(+)